MIDGEKLLIAFGGYNGKYNNEVFKLMTDFFPTKKKKKKVEV